MNKLFCLLLIGFVLLLSCKEDPSPENLKAKEYFKKGNDFYKQEKFAKAISEYNRAMKYDAKNPFIFLKRGDCYRKLRKPHNAIKDYNTVLRLRPTNARAWYHRGTLKIKLGKKREGCQDVRRARGLAYVPADNFYRENCQ